jgi:hypothetical protein
LTDSSERLEIALVAPNAADLCATLAERYPALPKYCDLAPVAHVLSPATPFDVATLSRNGAPTREAGSLAAVYACLDDESANLALALEAEYRLSRETPVFLPTSVAVAALGPFMLGVGQICPVVLPEDADSIDLLHDEMHESLSRQVHQAYLATRAGAADFGAKPADRSWDQLSEDARTSSRAHVDAMIEQLRAVWYDVEPLYDWDEPMTELSVPAVEAMAELEHLRWCKERWAAGWRYAPQRDPRGKLHDLLVPWPKLSEETKDIDRALVSASPLLFAKAGFRLVRDSARDALARRLHERYLEHAGDRTTGANAVPWDELTDAAREHNRAAVDHIAIKLARVGREAVPAVFGALAADLFSNEEIEELAELEHERWVEERLATGRQGPTDDAGRLHPWLVPWQELPEAEKEKDRDVVRAIPELLGAVGYVPART